MGWGGGPSSVGTLSIWGQGEKMGMHVFSVQFLQPSCKPTLHQNKFLKRKSLSCKAHWDSSISSMHNIL